MSKNIQNTCPNSVAGVALATRNNTASIETPQPTRNSFGKGECYEHSRNWPAATVAAIVAAIETEQRA